ncbi:hypothetical protein ACH4SK_31215 [Streptomyces inhibens]|uniref:hypothetical protein n=1 Tax=Streptomyces inhibens TaxID=2293571 RepID=UPI00379DE9E9
MNTAVRTSTDTSRSARRRSPEKHGSWKGTYTRLRNWAVNGTWERIFTAPLAQAHADEHLDRAVTVDSTIAPADHAAGARKRAPAGEPDDTYAPASSTPSPA